MTPLRSSDGRRTNSLFKTKESDRLIEVLVAGDWIEHAEDRGIGARRGIVRKHAQQLNYSEELDDSADLGPISFDISNMHGGQAHADHLPSAALFNFVHAYRESLEFRQATSTEFGR